MQFIGQRHATIFKNANSVKQGLLDYLTDIINMALYEEYPRGCFFINTATAFNTADKQVQSAIKHGAETVEQELIAFLEDGKYEGQIEGNKDTHALARYFLGLICGMNVIARVQKDRAILEDMVKIALEGL
jgi:TetR/AcrR family transcriptional repressor of nem operon